LADAHASQQTSHYIGIVFFHCLQAIRAQTQVQITLLTQLQRCASRLPHEKTGPKAAS